MLVDEAVSLGRTGLKVTRMGLGTAALGYLYEEVDSEEASNVVRAAYAAGIRLFDTAPLYGYGLAEQRLGSVLGTLPRESFVLSTKVGRLLRPDMPTDSTQLFGTEPAYKASQDVAMSIDFSYDGVMRSMECSLKRLGLDRIDILFIHEPVEHYEEAVSGAYRALADLRSQRVIGGVGVGMNEAEMLVRFARGVQCDCFLLAGRYSLLDQSGLRELLPLCQQLGISVVVGGVYNSGVLADPRLGSHFDYVPAPAPLVERALRFAEIGHNHGISLKAMALHFPFGHPTVVSVLIGCRSQRELQESIEAFQTEIPQGLWQELKAERLLAAEAPTP